jgi:hypothetical protein
MPRKVALKLVSEVTQRNMSPRSIEVIPRLYEVPDNLVFEADTMREAYIELAPLTQSRCQSHWQIGKSLHNPFY